jgi:hypothetical protein
MLKTLLSSLWGERMVSRSVGIGAVVAILAVTPVSAANFEGKAQLTSTNGKVLVNQGTGFVQPPRGMFLRTGDKIFVGHKASAAITYVEDQCQIAVPANRVVAIEVLSPCQSKAVRIQPTADLPETAQAEVIEPAFPWPLLLAIPVGLCIAFCFDDDDDDDRQEVTPRS